MEQKIVLSVVTVTYKPDVVELKLFIESFYRYNDLGTDARLIIVDNSPVNSWDTSAITTEYPNVVFIPNPSNPGFGASNNLGFEYYQSEYVLFVNNDVEFIEPVFEKLIKIHQSDNRIGCIGIHQKGGSPSFFTKMTAPKGIGNSHFDDEYHFISGAFMFFKSEVFKKIGKFDINIFMFEEEFDISNRLHKNGFYTKYENSLNFWHKTGKRQYLNEYTYSIGTQSFCYICKKYNLDPKKYVSFHRLYKLRLYHFLLLHFNEFLKINRIIRTRKKMIEKEFDIKL